MIPQSERDAAANEIQARHDERESAAMAERDAIVRWLRKESATCFSREWLESLSYAADAVKRGDHDYLKSK